MRTLLSIAVAMLACAALAISPSFAADGAVKVKEVMIEAPDLFPFKVRMQGPYDAEVPLQVVCYFKHKKDGDTTMGAAVRLDTNLGGAIVALRDRGDFDGDALETLVLGPPTGAIRAGMLLLIGLGDEETLSLDRMERVGRTALREAVKLGATRVAFAPLIRDQGNSRFSAGAVAGAVARGVLLACDTQKQLQARGLAKPLRIEEWSQEAGPIDFDETAAAVRNAIVRSGAVIRDRHSNKRL